MNKVLKIFITIILIVGVFVGGYFSANIIFKDKENNNVIKEESKKTENIDTSKVKENKDNKTNEETDTQNSDLVVPEYTNDIEDTKIEVFKEYLESYTLAAKNKYYTENNQDLSKCYSFDILNKESVNGKLDGSILIMNGGADFITKIWATDGNYYLNGILNTESIENNLDSNFNTDYYKNCGKI